MLYTTALTSKNTKTPVANSVQGVTVEVSQTQSSDQHKTDYIQRHSLTVTHNNTETLKIHFKHFFLQQSHLTYQRSCG